MCSNRGSNIVSNRSWERDHTEGINRGNTRGTNQGANQGIKRVTKQGLNPGTRTGCGVQCGSQCGTHAGSDAGRPISRAVSRARCGAQCGSRDLVLNHDLPMGCNAGSGTSCSIRTFMRDPMWGPVSGAGSGIWCRAMKTRGTPGFRVGSNADLHVGSNAGSRIWCGVQYLVRGHGVLRKFPGGIAGCQKASEYTLSTGSGRHGIWHPGPTSRNATML